MKLQKTSSQKNGLIIRNLMSIVEKKLSSLDNNSSIVEKFNSDELTDLQQILTMSELLLSKYENKKHFYQHMKKFVDILNSTIESLETMDGEIDELTISANFSMKKIKELESSLLNSKTDTYQLARTQLNYFNQICDSSLLT